MIAVSNLNLAMRRLTKTYYSLKKIKTGILNVIFEFFFSRNGDVLVMFSQERKKRYLNSPTFRSSFESSTKI